MQAKITDADYSLASKWTVYSFEGNVAGHPVTGTFAIPDELQQLQDARGSEITEGVVGGFLAFGQVIEVIPTPKAHALVDFPGIAGPVKFALSELRLNHQRVDLHGEGCPHKNTDIERTFGSNDYVVICRDCGEVFSSEEWERREHGEDGDVQVDGVNILASEDLALRDARRRAAQLAAASGVTVEILLVTNPVLLKPHFAIEVTTGRGVLRYDVPNGELWDDAFAAVGLL